MGVGKDLINKIMKKLLLAVFTLLLSIMSFAQTDSTFLSKVETKAVTNVDQFITKHQPTFDEKLGQLWEFAKTTTTSMYEAFVRYLIVKDSYPIMLWLVFLLVSYILYSRLNKFVSKNNTLFDSLSTSEKFTEYERMMVEHRNNYRKVLNMLYNSLPTILIYSAFVYTVVKIVPYIYNIVLLLIAPEARVLIEITNIYKSL